MRCDYADLSSTDLRDRHVAQIVDRLIASMLTRPTVGRPRPFAVIRPFVGLTNTDARLLQHVAVCASKFVAVRPEHGQIWKEVAVQAAQREPFLLHAFLAVASAHAGYLVRSGELMRISLEHKTLALRGAQQALAVFSRADAENVLATSLLLSWQAFYTEDHDPTGGSLFAALVDGIEAVLDAMGRWRDDFPLASLYYYTTHTESAPPPLTSAAEREAVILLLNSSVANCAPLCSSPHRSRCFGLLSAAIGNLTEAHRNAAFDSLPVPNQTALIKVFERWQLLFAPSDSYPSASSMMFNCDESVPLSNAIMNAYSRDPVVRLLFAYYYATSLLMFGFYPHLRRSKSFISRLGPLESTIWAIKQHDGWWEEVEQYAFFVTRVIDCYKLRSWTPVLDLETEFILPERIAEVLWYGMTESKILNTFANFTSIL